MSPAPVEKGAPQKRVTSRWWLAVSEWEQARQPHVEYAYFNLLSFYGLDRAVLAGKTQQQRQRQKQARH